MRSVKFAIRNSQRPTMPGLRVLRIAYCRLLGAWSSARRAGSNGNGGPGTGDFL